MVVWKGSCWEGRLTKKTRNTNVVSGKVLVRRLTHKKVWNATWFSGKVLGAEMPHGFPCFLGGSVGKVDAPTWFYFFFNCSSCRCRLLGGFGPGDEFCPKNVKRPHGFLSCSLQLEMSYGLWGWFGWEGFFTKKAGNVTLSLGRVWVGRPRYSSCCEGWLTKKMSVFPLCYCILFRCRLLAVFAVEMNLQKRNGKMPHGFLSLSLSFILSHSSVGFWNVVAVQVNWKTMLKRHMVFSLFNCISLRCRLLEGFGWGAEYVKTPHSFPVLLLYPMVV